MAMTLEDYLDKLGEWQRHVVRTCEDEEFVNLIAWPWFSHIAPDRALAYGIETLNRFGTRGVMAQIINCVERYKRIRDEQYVLAKGRDTYIDTFGYAVIMAITNGELPNAVNWPADVWKKHDPIAVYEEMIVDLWWPGKGHIDAGTKALSLAYGMWVEAWRIANA